MSNAEPNKFFDDYWGITPLAARNAWSVNGDTANTLLPDITIIELTPQSPDDIRVESTTGGIAPLAVSQLVSPIESADSSVAPIFDLCPDYVQSDRPNVETLETNDRWRRR